MTLALDCFMAESYPIYRDHSKFEKLPNSLYKGRIILMPKSDK